MASAKSTKDFLLVAEDYLSRGQVYRPAGEFVKKLALCPSCCGGKKEVELLLGVVSRMVALVKSQSNKPGRRNVKPNTAWLKETAQSLETYQLVGRDWISSHVWKLPSLPPPKQQEYDPTRGQRDIRYPKVAELLQAPGEDEVLDYEDLDEEKLLASPVNSNSTAGSPRRSPRLLKSASHIPEIRKAPTSTEAKPMEEETLVTCSPTADLPTEAQPMEVDGMVVTGCPTKDLTSELQDTTAVRACSSTLDVSGMSTLQKEKVQVASSEGASSSSEDRSRVQSAGARPKTYSRRDVEEPVRHVPMKNPEYSVRTSLQTGARSEGAYSSSEDRPYRVQWADSRPKVYRHRDVEPARTVKIKNPEYPVGILKRNFPVGKGEESVISMPVLKRVKTCDLLAHAKEKAEERREGEKKRRNRGMEKTCWVPGCMERAKYLKAHAFIVHIPSIFSETLDSTDERLLRGRRSALSQAGRWLLGKPVTLDELVAFVVVQKMLSTLDNTSISERQEAAMKEFCKFLHEPIPEKVTLVPCNSVGALLHWKVLLLLAASLSEEERAYWVLNFQAPEDAQPVAEAIPIQPKYPEAFDAHFHLDRTLHRLQLQQGEMKDMMDAVPVEESRRTSLVGGVSIYCDPETYPTDQHLRDLPQYISVGVGIHPRHARYSVVRVNQAVGRFQNLLANPRVAVFGEVGLDHSEPMKYWAYQVEMLEKMLPFLEDRHVLVIHCRGMEGDCGTEAFLLLLHVLKRYVRTHHPIHLHCFTGNR